MDLYAGASLPDPWVPFTPEEVAVLRAEDIGNVVAYRRKLAAELTAQATTSPIIPGPEPAWFASGEPGRPRILVRPRHLFIELEPDARPVVERDLAVLDDLPAIGDRRPVVAMEPVELEHQEIGDGGADMGRGHRPDRR